eukprot:200676-Chlamydomonas_euryale.AAC.12
MPVAQTPGVASHVAAAPPMYTAPLHTACAVTNTAAAPRIQQHSSANPAVTLLKVELGCSASSGCGGGCGRHRCRRQQCHHPRFLEECVRRAICCSCHSSAYSHRQCRAELATCVLACCPHVLHAGMSATAHACEHARPHTRACTPSTRKAHATCCAVAPDAAHAVSKRRGDLLLLADARCRCRVAAAASARCLADAVGRRVEGAAARPGSPSGKEQPSAAIACHLMPLLQRTHTADWH